MTLEKKYFECILQTLFKNYKSELQNNKIKIFIDEISNKNNNELINYLKIHKNIVDTIILLLESSRVSLVLIETVQFLFINNLFERDDVVKIINKLYNRKWNSDLQIKILQLSFYFMKFDLYYENEIQLLLNFVLNAMKSTNTDVSLIANPIAVQLIENIIKETKIKELEIKFLNNDNKENNIKDNKKIIKNFNNDKKCFDIKTNINKIKNVDNIKLNVDNIKLNVDNIKLNVDNIKLNVDEKNSKKEIKKIVLTVLDNLFNLFYDEILNKGNCLLSYIFFVFVKYQGVLLYYLCIEKITVKKFFEIILKIFNNGNKNNIKSAYDILELLHKDYYINFEDELNNFYYELFKIVNFNDEQLYNFIEIAFKSIGKVKGLTNIRSKFPKEILRIIDIFVEKTINDKINDTKRDEMVMNVIYEARKDIDYYNKYFNLVLDKFLIKYENNVAERKFINFGLNWAMENDQRCLFEEILKKLSIKEFIKILEQYVRYMGKSWSVLLKKCNKEYFMKIVMKVKEFGADELEVFIKYADGNVMNELFESAAKVLVLNNNIGVFIKLLEKCNNSDMMFDLLVRYYTAYQKRVNDKIKLSKKNNNVNNQNNKKSDIIEKKSLNNEKNKFLDQIEDKYSEIILNDNLKQQNKVIDQKEKNKIKFDKNIQKYDLIEEKYNDFSKIIDYDDNIIKLCEIEKIYFPYAPLICLKLYLKEHQEYYISGLNCLCEIIKITDIPGAWDIAFAIIETWTEPISAQVELIILIVQNYTNIINIEQWTKIIENVKRMCESDEQSTCISGIYIWQEINEFLMGDRNMIKLWQKYLKLCLEISKSKKDIVAVLGVRLLFEFLLSKYIEICDNYDNEFITVLFKEIFELNIKEIKTDIVKGMNRLILKYDMNKYINDYMKFLEECIKSDNEKIIKKAIDSLDVIVLKIQDKGLEYCENKIVEITYEKYNKEINNKNFKDNLINKKNKPAYILTDEKILEKIKNQINKNLKKENNFSKEIKKNIIEFYLILLPTFTGSRSIFLNDFYKILTKIQFDINDIQKLLTVFNMLVNNDSSIFPQILNIVEKMCLYSKSPESALLLFSKWISLNKFESQMILTRMLIIISVKTWDWNPLIENILRNLIEGIDKGLFEQITEFFISFCSYILLEQNFGSFVKFMDFFIKHKIKFAESRRTERKLLLLIELFMNIIERIIEAIETIEENSDIFHAFELIVFLTTRSQKILRFKCYQFLFLHVDKCFYMLVTRLKNVFSTYYIDFTNQGGNLEIMRLSEVVYSLKAIRSLQNVLIIDKLKLELNDLLLCQDYNIAYNVRECFKLLFTISESKI